MVGDHEKRPRIPGRGARRADASRHRVLLVLLLFYAAASLVHFVHNAEYLGAYPNLPESWSRAGVYLGWLVLSTVGLSGWCFVQGGYRRSGFLLLGVYALLGLDSLGHYVLASPSAHTLGMNATILLEVSAAALVFVEVLRQIVRNPWRSATAAA